MLNHKSPKRNLELIVSYNGTSFYGWQIQPDRVTVQGLLQNALRRVLQNPELKTTGASRTDTGVHAHDQHVSVTTTNPIPLDRLQRALGHLLPHSIKVRKIKEREPEFSARYHANGKHYSYFLYNGRRASPFISQFVWTHVIPHNEHAMHEAAAHFVGTRCFRALQAANDKRPGSETNIVEASVSRVDDIIRFDVAGTHFLYHMVRNMFGSLCMVGRGEWSPDELKQRLDSADRTQMGITAPPQGLHLFKVFYDEEPVGFWPESMGFTRFLAQA